MMTWNAYGGDMDLLSKAMTGTVTNHAGVNLDLDLVVLEEAANKTSNQEFYNPLKTLAHHSYSMVGPFAENFSVNVLPSQKKIYAAQGVNRSYVVLYRTTTINSVAAALVNWVTDANLTPPKDPLQAAMDGFNQRPPLKVTFKHKVNGADNAMTMFAWHAPVGNFNTISLQMLNDSATLAKAENNGAGRVIIAGDLNTADVSAYFASFSGLQDKFDYIMANFATSVEDLRKKVNNSTAVLDQLWGDAHPAVAGQISY